MNVGLADFIRMTETLYFGPVYPCGHHKTPENTYAYGKRQWCKECKKAEMRDYAKDYWLRVKKKRRGQA